MFWSSNQRTNAQRSLFAASTSVVVPTRGECFSLKGLNIASISSLQNEPPRLCSDLNNFLNHIESCVRTTKNGGRCQVCRITAFSKCGICNKFMHRIPTRGKQTNQSCFAHYHNESFFGLAKEDCRLVRKIREIGALLRMRMLEIIEDMFNSCDHVRIEKDNITITINLFIVCISNCFGLWFVCVAWNED